MPGGRGRRPEFVRRDTSALLEPVAVSAEGEILQDATIGLDLDTVSVDGAIVPDAQIVTDQFVPMGPAASQVAIKQSGTNGGGYTGVNSAHPMENPDAFAIIRLEIDGLFFAKCKSALKSG